MAFLSVLPGRIRIEHTSLAGRPHIGVHIQEHIRNDLQGITEVTVNHRTGRILVLFDEKQTDKQTILQYVRNSIKEHGGKAASTTVCSVSVKRRNPTVPAAIVNHAVMEIITHAVFPSIFPKPFNFLVPIAVKAVIRKKEKCNYCLKVG